MLKLTDPLLTRAESKAISVFRVSRPRLDLNEFFQANPRFQELKHVQDTTLAVSVRLGIAENS